MAVVPVIEQRDLEGVRLQFLAYGNDNYGIQMEVRGKYNPEAWQELLEKLESANFLLGELPSKTFDVYRGGKTIVSIEDWQELISKISRQTPD